VLISPVEIGGVDPMKRMLNPVYMFVAGAILGIVSKLLDVYTVNNVHLEQLGYMFSELSIWVLFGVIISIFSETQKNAMMNIFPFCVGMLITYYVTAEITDSIYGWAYIKGWLVFSCLSPVFAYLAWLTREKGLLSKVISSGIVIATIMGNFLLLGSIRASLSDFIVIPVIVYFLFFKKTKREELSRE
jgi:hypothetical protein